MEIKYKYKDLKVFSSTETMDGNTKKYRRVFDTVETAYIYAELSFYNKLFDEEDWKANVVLKAYSLKTGARKELCSIERQIDISKDQNIVIIREGWGNREYGAYWLRNDYEWEAFIDNTSVGVQRFFVENGGKVSPTTNPYFQIESVRLFESSATPTPQLERKYLQKFNGSNTRYIWLEFNFVNLQTQAWNAEIFFNFYNDSGQLKGNTSELRSINAKEPYVSFTAGWGSNTKGTWYNDKYTLEVLFMDHLIAVIPFEVADADVEGIAEYNLVPEELLQKIQPPTAETNWEDTLQKLNELVGLNDIKNKINDYVHYLKFVKIRKEQGFEEDQKISLHSVFLGNPGTGKTTVAKLLGEIYHKMGLLSKGKVTEVGRAELVGKFIGQTAPQVKEVIEKARGGVLFIDEAYALTREGDNGQDFGKEVIEVLLKEMSDGPGDIAIIVAGYPKEMNHLLTSNPGLKSRFNLFYDFEDYMPRELMQIAGYLAKKRSIIFTEDANAYLYGRLTEAYRNRDKTFGNARLVTSIVEQGKLNMGLRLMKESQTDAKYSAEQLQTVHKIDVERIFKNIAKQQPDIKVDEELLEETLKELNNLVGLQEVKNEVNEMVKLVRFYRETGKNILNKFSLHGVFLGNPGTGKTTVARLLAKIYKALGILEKGHLVEVDRQALVAGFIGQTAIKTTAVIDSAEGGILFIDEAYSLANGGEHDFGREAVETILKQMEDRRGQFVVIVAGYTLEMNRFLTANSGLKSRFDQTLVFQDYNAKDLFAITKNLIADEGLLLNEEAKLQIEKYFLDICTTKDQYFGNARTARKVAKETIKNQHLRMASIPSNLRSESELSTVVLDDIKSFAAKNVVENQGQSTIGFRIPKSE